MTSFGSEDQQSAAFERALEALRPGGWIAVIDAIDAFGEGSATVNTLFEDAGLVLLETPRRIGWRGRLLELRDRLANREPGAPPVMVAQKPKG